MVSAAPLNYTTSIPAMKTAGECQAILAQAGAASAAVHYEAGEPSGLSFSLKTPHGTRNFTLPVNVEGAHRMLVKAQGNGQLRAHVGKALITSRDHAARVAWRVVKDWLEAQLAIIAANMASLDEVMLPYLHVDDSRTLYQAYREREQAALPPGSGSQ
jgi:hypothetical protein